MRQTLEEYAEAVIHAEWPVQRRGELPSSGWRPLRKLHGQLVKFQPDTRGEAVIQAEFLRSLNELYKAREARLTAAAGHIPVVIWWIIGISGALTTAFTYLFGFHSFRMHLTMTGAIAASLALVVVLILALDWPFRGDVSVSPAPYVNVEDRLETGLRRDVVTRVGRRRRSWSARCASPKWPHSTPRSWHSHSARLTAASGQIEKDRHRCSTARQPPTTEMFADGLHRRWVPHSDIRACPAHAHRIGISNRIVP